MASGYIEYSDGTGTTLSNDWVKFALTTSSATGQFPIPTSGVNWTSLNVQIEGSSALDNGGFDIMMTWDTNGVYAIHGPSQSKYNLNFKTATNTKAALAIDLAIAPTFPSANSTNETIYVWLKGDTSSTNDKVKLVRLHFSEFSKG
tara:strand:+ start:127 stop:564 length:438 start_codon:yes stop_codon:yes gene_type:complete